jgi:hypothetical protein
VAIVLLFVKRVGEAMQIRKMTVDEMNEFLTQPLVAVFAVNESFKAPHQTPVWFRYDAKSGLFYVMSKSDSKKMRLLRELRSHDSISLCIQVSEGATAKYVNMSGDVSLEPLMPHTVEEFAMKYLSPIHREAYVASTPEDTLLIIEPTKIITGVI